MNHGAEDVERLGTMAERSHELNKLLLTLTS